MVMLLPGWSANTPHLTTSLLSPALYTWLYITLKTGHFSECTQLYHAIEMAVTDICVHIHEAKAMVPPRLNVTFSLAVGAIFVVFLP